jgi:hypothetical protein
VEDRQERDRIYHEALTAKLSAGTVHVYILGADGHCVDSQHVATASKVEELTPMLERNIEKWKPREGSPLVKPAAQSCPPKAEPDALMLHLTARNLRRQGNELVVPHVTLGETRSGNWGAYPGEDWICLTADECRSLFPGFDLKAFSVWDIDPNKAVEKILAHFYPSTENNNVAKNRFEEISLGSKVISLKDGIARVRLDGKLRMKHPFYHKEDNQTVEATIVGYFDIDVATKRIRDLRLVTQDATYGGRPFGVAVQTVP